jgi:hypothetical protein
MNLVENYLRRHPRARGETIQKLVRKQEMLQRLNAELASGSKRGITATAWAWVKRWIK